MARTSKLYSSRNRILISRFLAFILLLILLFTHSPDLLKFPTIIALGLFGLLLTSIGAFGRTWSAAYIAGRKTKKLVCEGPYSSTRNPLYFFSLLGAIGLGVASCNPALLILLLVVFMLYYPGVIAQEEEKLRVKHGASFEDYATRVPRVIPRPSIFWQPQEITVYPKPLTTSFGDAFWFIGAFIVIRSITWLHVFDVLPSVELSMIP